MATQHPNASEQLLARILAENPSFGSVGYIESRPETPPALELLAKLHSPNAAGPGPEQRA